MQIQERASAPRTRELMRPEKVDCPYRAEYRCEVAVIGCGFAGLNAAVSAREKGIDVLVIDKGRPGYSGLSPWPNSFRWFDPERDDADAFRQAALVGGDYITNMKWYEAWIQESQNIYRRLVDWGILSQYPKAIEVGDFFSSADYAGYRETFEQFDRHQKWVSVLERYGIPHLQHTMITDVITDDGQVQGAMGFHVPSGQVITVHAKSVVMATGGGCYKPSGFPVGDNTFDGEFMAYELGLPITGKEFEDSHGTGSVAPGSAFFYMNWPYLENIWLCGGDATRENLPAYIKTKASYVVLNRVSSALNLLPASDGTAVSDESHATYLRRAASAKYEIDPNEIRTGKMGSPMPASDLPGGAIGMSNHLTAGVLCDLEDTDGATAIAGLFVAGDGTHATYPGGAAYPCGRGFTSCFCSIDGDHAGKAAAAFAATNEMREIDPVTVASKAQAITAPRHVERGVDPNWARDVLHGIMAPYWVTILKSQKILESTLVQVEYMRDHVVPALQARTSHELRLCHEMKHKVLSAEMKLRASMTRRESRGATYRVDYPYRNDEEFLCYITLQKTENGEMQLGKIPAKDAWRGDCSQPYGERFSYLYPGEAQAKGLPLTNGERGRMDVGR